VCHFISAAIRASGSVVAGKVEMLTCSRPLIVRMGGDSTGMFRQKDGGVPTGGQVKSNAVAIK
jgi:hypothetical protein